MERLPLAIAVLAAILATVAGCDGQEAPPSPPIVSVQPHLDETASAYVGAVAASLAAQAGIRIAVVDDPAASLERPFVVIEGRELAEGDGLAIPVRYWGAFANFWSPVDEVSSEGLRWALRGQVTDWLDLGAPPGRLTAYLPRELRPGLERLLGPLPTADTGALRWVPVSEAVDRTAADAGALTLLPLDSADPRLRSLTVDGIDTVRGVGNPVSSPLAERLWLRWEGEEAALVAGGLVRALTAPVPSPIRIIATGDIIPARCVYARQRDSGDYRRAFLATADYLRTADLTLGSLDASLSDAGEPFGCTPTFSLLAPARSVEGLVHAGLDVVTVATNHVKDCGTSYCGDRAFLDTLANLRAAGIAPVGGGENLAEARRPVVLTVGGVRFAFLGYDEVASSAYGATETSPGTAPLNYGVLAEDVAVALQEADVVVVMNQWGIEYTPMPTERQTDLAREAIGAGATLVVGNHPHVVQAVEWLDKGFVAYGLGNFVFDQDWSLETQQGVVLEAVFHGPRLASVRFRPIHIYDQHQPRWAPAEEARSILARMKEASEALAASP